MSPSGVLPVPHRPLRLDDERVYWVRTSDGKQIRLTRFKGGDKGPVVLAPGYGTSTLAYTIDTIETNFPEFLGEHGYDIWLLDYRASPALEAAATDYTIDDIAQRDWPAAIAKVREESGAESVQVIAHCVGSLSFLMAQATGLEGVRSAICSQLGIHPIPVPVNRARAAVRMAALLRGGGIERLSATFRPERFEDRALEAMMKRWPTREKCDNPVCRRILFIFGESYTHAQLNEETHDALEHIFGKTRMTAFKHLSLMVRKGHSVDRAGKEAYMPHLDRLAIPITFLHGERNRMFIPKATERTYELLRQVNDKELYSRHIVPGYAHMDCWVGKDAARDVYPLAVRELERFN